LGKMGKVAEGGRTILFVSHQMNQVRRLCQRALWVEDGSIRADGPAKLVVNQYEAASLESDEVRTAETNASITFGRWQVEASGTNVVDLDHSSDRVVIRIQAWVSKPTRKGQYFISLKDGNNTIVWSNLYYDLKLDPGPVTFVHEFSSLPLLPGIYTWDVHFHDGHNWVEYPLLPQLSIVSRTDSHLDGPLKGFLNLASEMHLELGNGMPSVDTSIVEAELILLKQTPEFK
jgi:hypothetical protein